MPVHAPIKHTKYRDSFTFYPIHKYYVMGIVFRKFTVFIKCDIICHSCLVPVMQPSLSKAGGDYVPITVNPKGAGEGHTPRIL